MRVQDSADLGLLVRDERRHRGLTQAELGATAGVSRRWLSDFEAGKSTIEVGLVFKVLHALDLILEANRADRSDFDLDDVLRAYGQPRESSEKHG